mgnify:CR=1 FL=1
MEKYRILMIGPAYGHNIETFLNFFNSNSNYELTLVYEEHDEFSSVYQNVKFVPLTFNLKSIISFINIIRKPYHLIWHHGGTNLGSLLLINVFHLKKTIVTINIWGPVILQRAVKNNFKGFLFRYFFKRADIIQCNWYGTKKQLDCFHDESKSVVMPWGLEKSFFLESNSTITKFTEDFIAQIPKNKTVFFYPKSIIPQTCHKEIVEAALTLVEKEVDDFIIYFWLGNWHHEAEINRIRKFILDCSLEKHIEIVFHDFLPFHDMKVIWEHVDAGFMLVKDDQLSTALLEPLILKKEVIASNIYPFQKLLDLYPALELKFVENSPNDIAQRMVDVMNNKLTSDLVFENRKKIIGKEFNFDNNIEKMIDYYQSLGK